MAYQFPPDVDHLVKKCMAQGCYESEDEVLRDALRALEEVALLRRGPALGRFSNFESLRHEVSRGLEQLERGEGCDADEVFDKLLRDSP